MESIAVGKNISKIYHNGEIGTTSLNNISFEIQPGSLVSFVGPSGSGKFVLMLVSYGIVINRFSHKSKHNWSES